MRTISGLALVLFYEVTKLKSTTGYNLAKLFPNVSHQQVYRELRYLEYYGALKSTVEPQTGKPDRLYYSPSGKFSTADFITYGVSAMPINGDISTYCLEALWRCADIIDKEVARKWINQAISVYFEKNEAAKAGGITAETFLRQSYLDFLYMIKSRIIGKPSERAQKYMGLIND